MRYVRMNQICLDLDEVETIEWKKIDEDETLGNSMYTLRVHMKSGKMFTRQVYETQFEELKEQFKDILNEERTIKIGD
jgi:hypothetical protein